MSARCWKKAGLDRIIGYLGVRPQAKTLDEIAAALPLANPGFLNVPASRWREEAERHFRETATGVDLNLRTPIEAELRGRRSGRRSISGRCSMR